jgi:hypothetical protein
MALKVAHMLSMSGLQATPLVPPSAPPKLIVKGGDDSHGIDLDGGEPDGVTSQTSRRTRIWEFATNLHCSIIGTCLSTADLRHVLEKLKVNGAAAASDHDLHCLGVMVARRRDCGARFLQKALDRRHRSTIIRYSRAKEPTDLIALWDESLKQGEIPGAYWAALTHPATTQDIINRVFGDVHMLSHLMGAANRADIRRLRQLETDNAALAEKVERQQRQLSEGFAGRDRAIRHLNELVARQASERSERPHSFKEHDDGGGIDAPVHDLNRRLAREAARRERSELRASELSAALKDKDRELQASRQECESSRQALDIVERQLAALTRPQAHGPEAAIDLSGVTLLYVGGRAHQIPQLKDMIERTGAHFLYHDGGIENNPGLIPGLVSRADRVFFPIDCISHDAVTTIKRICRVTGKTYEPLRNAGLTCLLSAMVRMSGYPERVAGG